ncbi:hypothetical protein DFA_04029 [Cavenderia fasciculata]|uniref:Vitamin K epoxide reductase domain-containing protein n=1 Tax=Cavenderia fasciculata TaxID=261658 RepID=F4Q134_CACFS|nr:uncharacterized protein DFA_04029 [Cavenderia fasciculata]EGG18535.1 hypothetical protein DFA_04029 [Cavenderia fasciculata]|eukprot:XP_004366439.1 hypothetical protein DFA_04029 [Cavenderia fasciculata]
MKSEMYTTDDVDDTSRRDRDGGYSYLPLNNNNINSNSTGINNINGHHHLNNSNGSISSSIPNIHFYSHRKGGGLFNNSIHMMGVLGLVSLAFSFYLAFGNIESGTCDISAKVSCSTVLKSSFAEILGVPVAIFGLTWNAVLLFTVWRVTIDDKVPHYISFIYIWCSIGIGFVIYFVAAEFIIGALCPFCTVVHVINVIMMYISFQLYNDLRNPPILSQTASLLRPMLISIVLVHLVIVGLFWAATPEKPSEPIMNTFARCLGERHMVFYGSDGCHACKKQKELFVYTGQDEANSPWKHIRFVECFKNNECQHHNIAGYPTWIRFADANQEKEIDRHKGVMKPEELSKMSGCPYNPDQQQQQQNNNSNNNINNNNNNKEK